MTAVHFLLQVLVKLVTNPYPYTDKAADLVQEASILQVNLFKQDADNVSIPISHIDGMPSTLVSMGLSADVLENFLVFRNQTLIILLTSTSLSN